MSAKNNIINLNEHLNEIKIATLHSDKKNERINQSFMLVIKHIRAYFDEYFSTPEKQRAEMLCDKNPTKLIVPTRLFLHEVLSGRSKKESITHTLAASKQASAYFLHVFAENYKELDRKHNAIDHDFIEHCAKNIQSAYNKELE
jgi:hypothetical protein